MLEEQYPGSARSLAIDSSHHANHHLIEEPILGRRFGSRHGMPLEQNFTTPQYGAQQVQGLDRSFNSPQYSNQQVQGPERDFTSPQMNEGRLRHPNHDQAEGWYQDGNRHPYPLRK
ncbi:hypothetical protein GGP41_010628 [Bipolaris sorokiniana]|uniref:Uncharacterized protein n=1 Tax=Cochliobolus sativus TaxID=45130 RepID=A0A8H5ZIR7_COCSA|nr:hypothetical protein GGP41_010628 [Bipolaris sorokiniana]